MAQEIEITDASIELTDHEEYELYAKGTLVLDGPLGKLTVLKTWKASPKYDGLMDEDKISEHIKYYHPESKDYEHNVPFDDGGTDWKPGRGPLGDEESFRSECEAALLADPEVEYIEALRGTRFGISEALDDAYTILMASEGRVGLTEAQAEAYALREVHDVQRKWAAIALGKDPSGLDNLQRTAREKVETLRNVADTVERIEKAV